MHKWVFELISQLIGYFSTVIFILVHPSIVGIFSDITFYRRPTYFTLFIRKMLPTMLFGFSISSSNASIPVVLNTTTRKLGVKESIGAFIIPLGATINMDGTVIMQGVATVFIANLYGIDLNLTQYAIIIANCYASIYRYSWYSQRRFNYVNLSIDTSPVSPLMGLPSF